MNTRVLPPQVKVGRSHITFTVMVQHQTQSKQKAKIIHRRDVKSLNSICYRMTTKL